MNMYESRVGIWRVKRLPREKTTNGTCLMNERGRETYEKVKQSKFQKTLWSSEREFSQKIVQVAEKCQVY